MAIAATINESTYGKLLARALPRVITSKKENERMIAELERLDARGRALTPEEEKLAELMTLLVRQFEESKYPLGHAEPLEALRILTGNRGLRQRDLDPGFRIVERCLGRVQWKAIDQQGARAQTRCTLSRSGKPFYLNSAVSARNPGIRQRLKNDAQRIQRAALRPRRA